MGTVFSNMSSWTALTRYLGTKTTFDAKFLKSKYARNLIFITFYENAYLHKNSIKTLFYEFLVLENCITL